MRAASSRSPALPYRRASRATVVSTPSVTSPSRVHRSRLPLGVPADELDRVERRRVVLDVRRLRPRRTESAAARGSRAAAARSTRASAGLARHPDLLDRPLARPLGGDEVVVLVRRRACGRVQLDQVLDLEPRVPQRPEHVAVTEVELDAAVRPSAMLCIPRCARWSVSEVPSGSSSAHRITSGLLHRNTSRPPGRSSRYASGSQHVRVAPDARAVLGEREVEALVGKRDGLGARLEQRELDAGLGLEAPRRLELRRGDVDADRPRAAPGEPRREVRRCRSRARRRRARRRRRGRRRPPRARRTCPR